MATIKNTIGLNDNMSTVLKAIINTMETTINTMDNVARVNNSVFTGMQKDTQIASHSLNNFVEDINELEQQIKNMPKASFKIDPIIIDSPFNELQADAAEFNNYMQKLATDINLDDINIHGFENVSFDNVKLKAQELQNQFLNLENAVTPIMSNLNNLDNTTLTNLQIDTKKVISQAQLFQQEVHEITNNLKGLDKKPFNSIQAGINKSTSSLTEFDKMMDSAIDGLNNADKTGSGAFKNIQKNATAAASNIDKLEHEIKELPAAADKATKSFHGFKNPLVTAASAIYTIKATLQKIASMTDVADNFTLTYARLDLINDGLLTTDQLQNKILASARRSRAEYSETAAAISKMGLLAGEAFESAEEIIAFTELMNKSFKIGGSTMQEQVSAMHQLTQAMAAGTLQGDEFRSIIENAPMLADAIAKFMGKSKGELKDLSSEGMLTADVIKGSMFYAAEDINSTFEKMPKTFGDVWTSVKNDALEAFQPIIEKASAFVNSKKFNKLSTSIVNGIMWIANKAIDLMNLASDIVKWVEANESTIKNVLYVIGGLITSMLIIKMIMAAQAFVQAGKLFGLSFKTAGILTIIALIAYLILWIVELYKTNEDFRNKVQQVWTDYGDAIVATITAIAAIFATLFFPTISAAITSTLTLMWTTIKATAAMVVGWIQVGLAFLAANWWILIIVAAIAVAIYAWQNFGEAGKILAIIIGAVVAAIVIWIAVQKILNLALTANPIGVIIMAIAALIAIIIAVTLWIIDLWETNMDFKYGVIKIWNSILNFFDQVPLFFQWVGNGIADAFSSAKLKTIEILESMANGAIGIINDLITQLNKIPGVSIGLIDELSLSAIAAATEEAKKQSRDAELLAGMDAAAQKAAAREAKMNEDRAADEARIAAEKAAAEAKKQSPENNWEDAAAADYPDYPGLDDIDWSKYQIGQIGAEEIKLAGGDIDSIDSVGSIKDDVSITDEDIKLLKDVATAEYVNKYTTLRPEMQVTFGDVRETADVKKILSVMEDMIEEAYASALITE